MERLQRLLATGAILASSCGLHAEEALPSKPRTAPEGRRAYFGELHLHTGYSLDAYALMGSRTGPEDAYRFGEGLPVSYLGQTVRRPRPLDFMAVTDHAEYLGAFHQLDDPDSVLSKTGLGAELRSSPIRFYVDALSGKFDAFPGLNLDASMATAWKRIVEAADRHYRAGEFTTFVAFEWTTLAEGKYNLHRNVIFRSAPPPAPFSFVDSPRPEDLWSYLERLRAQGIEALAIPHNSNASGGLMFDWKGSEGRPISEVYAQRRAMNEPLVEVYQHKGQSETSPLLSPNDEFADFERVEELVTGGPGEVDGSYARQALGRGLVVWSRVSANPFEFGFVGASDFHNGLSDSRESAYAGVGLNSTNPGVNLPDREHAKAILESRSDATGPPKTMRDLAEMDPQTAPGRINWSGAGSTGVWAEENTRESIFAALRRRETFATSGPRLRLRFFGGWNVPADATSRRSWVSDAYRSHVPMGGDLPALPAGADAPGFIVQAAKDPTSAHLDRIQIIKISLDGDDYREQVFDVVWSPERRRDPETGRVPAVRSTVDLETATYSNAVGAPELVGVWHDAEFDPDTPAVYYARAVEIPTPRWTTLLAVARGLPLPTGVPATLQERAISSPIWYTPPARQRP